MSKSKEEKKNCKHKNWKIIGFIRISGGQNAQERECNDCKLKIIV